MLFEWLIAVNVIGRAKFVYGECHCIEKTAGVILARSYALLVGNAVFCCAYEILRGADDSYNRENTEAYEQKSVSVLVAKTAAEIRCNDLGDISTATARTA